MLRVDDQRFLTPSEAAMILGVSKRTVIRWSANGSSKDRRPSDPPDLQPLRGPNRRIYFREERIRFIANQYFGTGTPNRSRAVSVA